MGSHLSRSSGFTITPTVTGSTAAAAYYTWNLPMGPSSHGAKPADRDWYAPLTIVPKGAFFRLRVELD